MIDLIHHTDCIDNCYGGICHWRNGKPLCDDITDCEIKKQRIKIWTEKLNIK